MCDLVEYGILIIHTITTIYVSFFNIIVLYVYTMAKKSVRTRLFYILRETCSFIAVCSMDDMQLINIRKYTKYLTGFELLQRIAIDNSAFCTHSGYLHCIITGTYVNDSKDDLDCYECMDPMSYNRKHKYKGVEAEHSRNAYMLLEKRFWYGCANIHSGEWVMGGAPVEITPPVPSVSLYQP